MFPSWADARVERIAREAAVGKCMTTGEGGILNERR